MGCNCNCTDSMIHKVNSLVDKKKHKWNDLCRRSASVDRLQGIKLMTSSPCSQQHRNQSTTPSTSSGYRARSVSSCTPTSSACPCTRLTGNIAGSRPPEAWHHTTSSTASRGKNGYICLAFGICKLLLHFYFLGLGYRWNIITCSPKICIWELFLQILLLS